MKKNPLSLLAVACIAVASQVISCTPAFKPVRMIEASLHSRADSSRYRLDEIIVMFKSEPNSASINKIKGEIQKRGVDPATIEIRTCNSCNEYIELWHAPNLHSVIQSDGLVAGTRSGQGGRGAGEDDLAYYSLNFMQNIELDSTANFVDFYDSTYKALDYDTEGKDVIRVAVLDTGIDTTRISKKYRWTNESEMPTGQKQDKVDNDNNCYTDDALGWNFTTGNVHDVKDRHKNLHGTLVSYYIINEFGASPNNAVKIMTLKTHDDNGYGDLFSGICAIHYAMDNGANIINASWGFYYYEDSPHPYLDHLITDVLRRKGILFIAAAGNKIESDDATARKAYFDAHGVNIPDSLLRNLKYHNFYPACLSNDDNNVITVTTADTTRVSPTQNYSPKYVDMGAIPDEVTPLFMKFNVPFGPIPSISGSSFAAPIVTGRIGAFLPTSFYVPGVSKTVALDQVNAPAVPGIFPFLKSKFLEGWRIRNGRTTPHYKKLPM